MSALLLLVALSSTGEAATSVDVAEIASLQASFGRARAHLEQGQLDAAAHIRWPLLDPAIEQVLIENRGRLGADARREWAYDRALPMLAGELPATDEVLRDVLLEVASATHAATARSNADLVQLQSARTAYAARQLKDAVARYAAVTQASPLWPDALRERAWTLLLLGRPGEALGATVSLGAPYFPYEDHAEARLMRATVLLQKCRFEEACTEVAALADAPVEDLDERAAAAAVASASAPAQPHTAAAWGAPLVSRVRSALAAVGALPPDDPLRRRLVSLGARLMQKAFETEIESTRDAKERALKIRYESLRTERGLLERGMRSRAPTPQAPPLLDDDEVAWSFDGTFWRDELGNYRYTAGDACPQGASP